MCYSDRRFSVRGYLNLCNILCVILYASASTHAQYSYVDQSTHRADSYFRVLDDVANKARYLGNAVNVDELNEWTVDNPIFRFHHHLTGLVYGTVSENEYDGEIREVLDALSTSTLRTDEENHDYKTPYSDDIPKEDHRLTLPKTDIKMDTAEKPTCINDTGLLIMSLVVDKAMWALEFFDATGKPGPSLTKLRFVFVGNYDQCRAASSNSTLGNQFGGAYNILNVKLKKIPVQFQIGLCMPDTCSAGEITVLANQLFRRIVKNDRFEYAYAYRLSGDTEMTAATKASIAILSIIGFFMVIGTIFDLWVIQKPKWKKARLVTNTSSVDIGNGHTPGVDREDEHNIVTDGEKSPLLQNGRSTGKMKPADGRTGILAQTFLSFSVYSNAKKILNTSQQPGSLGSIHGIRFLSMSWVVLCHMFAFCSNFAKNTFEEVPGFYERWTFLPISNGFVSVDTFFTLSGLLTSYLTIKEMMRRETFKINWPLFYFHRFWRLTPPYMFAMVIVLGMQQYFGQGPLWSPKQPMDKTNCEKNWWTNLLYINNLIKFDEGCFGHSWYLANDMQFFVLSPLMLIPFVFNRLAGFFSCVVFLLASWITTGVLSSQHNWGPTSVTLHPPPGRASPNDWMQHYYIVPWCRIGPFVVGVMAGYVLAVTKGKQFRMPRWLAALGWIAAATAGLAVVYGLSGDIKGDNPSSRETAAFYNTVNRSVWGACVSWVIIACSAGYGGPVNSLLSWSPFVVLGRLTYMSYLIHICIIYTFYQNLDDLFMFNDTTMVVYYLGILLFVNLSAFVCVLALESPMLGLEKTFIKKF